MSFVDPVNEAATVRDSAGQGRLSHVLSTRGTESNPERPFVIEHREALIYMLSEAAELEHAILCQYLFAAMTLKKGAEEGLSADQLQKVERWRKTLLEVAAQEMLHLALVQNLLTSIGASPHLSRPNMPHPARHFPPGVQIALLPFGERAIRHFLYLERPEGMDIDDADGFEAVERAEPMMLDEVDIVPMAQDFSTVGHLYRAIEEGFEHLVEKWGKGRVFVGPLSAQAASILFGWPELVSVVDLASAKVALETIVEQGEGAQGDWREAHFGRFHDMLDDYLATRATDPDFDPARPAMHIHVRPPETGAQVPLCGTRSTARVVDLFNVSYEILLQVLYRLFAHTEETEEQIKTLADVGVGIMWGVMMPLGELITRLPVGSEYPDKTAGPSFELFYETDYFFPHLESAWILMHERLHEAAGFADRIIVEEPGLAEPLSKPATALHGLADRLVGAMFVP